MGFRKVTDPAILQQLGAQGQVVAPNPMFPGQMQGQALNNQGQNLQNQTRSAELPYVAPKAAADARNAATQANVNAATAPAEISTKNANARKTAIEATTAERNLETTGGANEGQSKSASFYNRAFNSNRLYEGTGIKDQPAGRSIALTLLPDALVNEFTSPQRQSAEAAQRDFIAATLRYESGANIPQNEFDLQKAIFFPAPGDKPETIAMKALLRQNAINGLKVAAGPAGEVLNQSNQPPVIGDASAPQLAPASTTIGQVAQTVMGNAPNTNEFDPQTSAAIDQLIRMGRPVNEIVAFAKSRGFDQVDVNAARQAETYAKAHPEYKGGFTQATRSRPVTLGEAISGSPIGAGLSAAGTAATAGFNDELAGLLSAAQGGNYAEGRDAFNANKQLVSNAHPYADFAGTVLGSALTMGALGKGLQGLNIPEKIAPAVRYGRTADEAIQQGITRAGTLGDIAYGGAFGAGENNSDRLSGALTGAGAAAAGNMIGRGAATTLGGIISPTGGRAASLYEIGVRPSIGQRFGGITNNIEEKLKSIPIVGDAIEGTRDRARDQFQIGLFNKSLGEIGQGLPKGMKPGHEAHAFAQQAFDQAYDAAKSNMTAAADSGLSTDLGNLQRTVLTLKPDSQKTFNKLWSDSVARRFADGSLSGAAYKDATSELERRIAKIRSNQSGDGELADALQEAVDALRSSAKRNSSPEAIARMDAVDRGYTTLVQLETASKAAGGDAATFTPKQFESAVKNTNSTVRKRGFLAGKAPNTELANAGLTLDDVVSNSGTIDRLVPAAALFGTAGYVAPKSLLGLGLYGALNAPGVRNVVTGALAPRGGAPKTLADFIRSQKDLAGMIGSGIGVGLLPSR